MGKKNALGFVSYEVDNDRVFDATIKQALKSVRDLRIPFKEIALDFYKSEKAIFQLKGPGAYPPFKNEIRGHKGTKKNPFAKTRATITIKESPYQRFKKKKYGFDYPLLKATGDLERSVTRPDDKNSILAIDEQSMAIGTAVEYGKYHQQDDYAGKKIPMRKFLFIGPESPYAVGSQRGRLTRWNKIIKDHVLRMTTGAGPGAGQRGS